MKSESIEFAAQSLNPGLCGLVQAVGALMRARGGEADEAELLGISSAAFCNYVFDPKTNQHEDEPRGFSPHAGMFSNYGPWESIGYYTGWEVLEVNALSAVETLKVVVFEIAQGRPIVTLTPELKPTLITGYSVSVDDRIVHTQAGDFSVTDAESLQGDDDLFHNWLLLVREGEQPEWAATLERQRIDVVRWAAEHGANPREFFQETRENYAPGLAGIRRFRELLDGLTEPGAVEHAERYVRELHVARSAAATCLNSWAGMISEALDQPSIRTDLEDAARRYAEVARTLAEAPNFVEAFAAVEPLEAAALDSLLAATSHFPSPFEA